MYRIEEARQKHSRLRRIFRAPSNEGGFVLVTILLIIAVLFPLVMAFNSRVQINLLQAANHRDSIQALRMARSGVEGAIGMLKSDDASYDTMQDPWAMDFPAIGAGEGVLQVKIVDEESKIAVNRLVASNGVDVNKDIDERLRTLIEQLGGKPEIVDALIDWLDVNNEISGAAGAEEEAYRGQGYDVKNGPLDSIDELLLIKGFDKELLYERKLSNYLTVAPVTDDKININTAPPEVLRAVLGTKTASLATPLNDGDIEDIVRYREEHEFKTVKDVEQVIKVSTTQMGSITPLIKVNSSFFTVHSAYTIGKISKSVDALLKREGQTVTTIAWREP
jgi:general secretion pathway protein K